MALSEPIAHILDTARRCMLRAPIVFDLDQITSLEPVHRCILVAKAIEKTVGESSSFSQVLDNVAGKGVNASLSAAVREHEVIDLLRFEAKARQGGDRVSMPALVPARPLERQAGARHV
jgi:hypothetical protein